MSKGQSLTFYGLFDFVEAIEIPIIQRDYAQGREEAVDVRTQFLDSLHYALLVNEESEALPLDLDFVYGSFEGEDGDVLSVLDGQQRLTTLFLLHWFLALKNCQLEAFRNKFVTSDGLSRFRYKTRHSTTDFFNALTSAEFEVDDRRIISDQICDSHWFFSSWMYDPTVQSCLCMLDAIALKFGQIDLDLYERITNTVRPYVTFQYLNLRSFKLSDDLYIKMNARGKPLTPFENFKAWVLERAKTEYPASNFEHKVDLQWTDLFWKKSVEHNSNFDLTYLSFFNLIAFFHSCEITEGSYTLLSSGEKAWLRYIREPRSNVSQAQLEKINAFTNKDLVRVSKILDFMVANQDINISNLFLDSLKIVNNLSHIKFYALIAFVENAPDIGFWGEDVQVQFVRWLRVTDNLINNHRLDDMTSFIATVKAIKQLSEQSQFIYEGITKKTFEIKGFALEQWNEEILKAQLILTEPQWEISLKKYESHKYLKGKVGFILKMACNQLTLFEQYADKVCTLLGADVLGASDFALHRALLTVGNYLIEDGYNRYSFGSSTNTSYRERSENWFRIVVKPFFKELVDKISSTEHSIVMEELRRIIDKSETGDWRDLVVKHPETIDYCKEKLIHKQGNLIYLLSKTNRRGYHAELYSFVLSLRLKSLHKSGNLPTEISLMNYEYVYGDETPKVRLKIGDEEFGVCFKDEKYTVVTKTAHPLYNGYLVDTVIETPAQIINLLLILGITEDAIA